MNKEQMDQINKELERLAGKIKDKQAKIKELQSELLFEKGESHGLKFAYDNLYNLYNELLKQIK